jgi:hypothetical protein
MIMFAINIMGLMPPTHYGNEYGQRDELIGGHV